MKNLIIKVSLILVGLLVLSIAAFYKNNFIIHIVEITFALIAVSSFIEIFICNKDVLKEDVFRPNLLIIIATFALILILAIISISTIPKNKDILRYSLFTIMWSIAAIYWTIYLYYSKVKNGKL